MRIYIAGPMTGYERNNFDAFRRATKKMKRGNKIISPLEHSIRLGWTDQGGNSGSIPLDVKRAALEDVEAITSCDAIYMLKGWEKSIGARAEHAVAVWIGLEIMYE